MYTVATMNAPELVVLALRVLSAWNAGRAPGREDAAVLRPAAFGDYTESSGTRQLANSDYPTRVVC